MAQVLADFLVAKGQVFSQTSGAAPTLLTTGGAVFDAEVPGFGGPPIVSGGTVSLPGGGSRTLAYISAISMFQFEETANTLSSLDSTYPAGLYTIKLDSTLIPGLTAGINLSTDNFPPVPTVVNLDALQSVIATNSFELTYQPFAGATAPDDAMLIVYDGSTLILSNVLSLDATSFSIAANTLAAGKTYDGRLRFRHLTETKTGLLPSAAGFYSETRFSIKTQSSGGGQTPPTLLAAMPASGGALLAAQSGLGLHFSKAMDHGRGAIQWAATLNGTPVPLAETNFLYEWSDAATLNCLYAPFAGGWPIGLVVSWTLNATSNNPGNFADTEGNLLPVATYSGNFVTYGGPWNCVAAVSNAVEAPGFYLTKRLNYVQSSDDLGLVDPRMPAQFQAYFKDPGSSLIQSVTVAVPVPGSTNYLLNSLAAVSGPANGSIVHWLSDTYSATAAMDGVYPVGNYVLQLRTLVSTNPSNPLLVTNSASLTMVTAGYPPQPRFSNFTAAQHVVVTNDFTLTWDAYAGVDTNTAFMSLQVLDSSSNVVLSAPNACAGVGLPTTATSLTIPANTLASNQVYTAVLSFGLFVGSPEFMNGVPGLGFSALQRTTRLGLNGPIQLPPPPPTVTILRPIAGEFVTAGNVSVQVSAADTNAALTQLQLFNHRTNLLATLAVPAGQSNFTGAITGVFPDGSASATVVATDANGQQATAGPLVFTAQDPAFAIGFSSPTNGAVYRAYSNIPLVVTATSPSGAIAEVDFYMDGSQLGSAGAPPFAWSVPGVAPGSHQFYALAQDSAGYRGISPTVMVTVAPPDLASDKLTNIFLEFTIGSGTAPFASSGGYQLFTSMVGTNYDVLGNAGASLNSGTYTYTKTGTNSAVMTLADTQGGSPCSLHLHFSTAATGSYTVNNQAGGSQSGTFVLAPLPPAGPLGIFVLSGTNSPFQLFVSGQGGVNYATEVSSNLNVWSELGKLAVTNLTTSVNDPSPPAVQRFYRARLDSTSFAPDSMAAQTLNFSITSGRGSWPTNGILQWISNATNNTYQLIGGPGATDRAGTWSYVRTGPDRGTVVGVDSQTGAQTSWQLKFTSTDAGFYYATNAGDVSGSQSGTFRRADGVVEFLGNVRLTGDTGRRASAYFPADGTAASLSVTNADGYIWTLSLPADALLTPRTITMTPVTNLDASASLLPLVSGVQLGPEGAQFSSGVTLTVTAPKGFGPHASLLMADGDGSNLYFVPSTNAANSYSATLFHFSSASASDPSDQQWEDFLNKHLPEVQAAYAQAKSDVKALERPVVVPPEPPDYELTCDSSGEAAANAAIDAYAQQLFAKESDAIRRLLGAARDLALLGQDPGEEPLALALQLIETAGFRKVDSLFSHYRQNPKKFTAVARVSLSIARQDELLGGAGRPDWLEEIASWASRVLDYYFKKLRDEHDYSLVTVLFQIEREIQLLGGAGGDSQFFADVANALTFKLTVDIQLTAPDTQIEAQGDLTMTTDPSSFILRGSGSINYLSGSIGSAVLLPGQSFSQNVVVTNFEACTNLVIGFAIDRLGADSESWEAGGVGFQGTFLKILAGGSFIVNGHVIQPPSPYVGQLGFSATLHNRDAEAVNQTFEAAAEGANAKLSLILLHTPK